MFTWCTHQIKPCWLFATFAAQLLSSQKVKWFPLHPVFAIIPRKPVKSRRIHFDRRMFFLINFLSEFLGLRWELVWGSISCLQASPLETPGFFGFLFSPPTRTSSQSWGVERKRSWSCGRNVFGMQDCSMRCAARLRSTTEACIDSTCAVRSGTIMGPLASGSFQSFRFS